MRVSEYDKCMFSFRFTSQEKKNTYRKKEKEKADVLEFFCIFVLKQCYRR